MNKLLILAFSIMLISCNSDNITPSGIGDFQLSNDDKFVYFSFYDGINSSIFRFNSNGSNLKYIVPAKKDTSFYNPSLSMDNEKILFIGWANQSNNSSIYLANLDGSSVKRMTEGNEIIWDAFISDYNNEIIYSKADAVTKYSPIATSGPHGFDLFTLNTINKKTKKISSLNAYQLGCLSEFNKDSLLVYSYTDKSGMFFFSKKKQQTLTRIEAKNESIELPNFYYQPLYSKKYDCFVFSNGYGLKIMDKHRIVKKIYDVTESKIHCFCLYNLVSRVLFTIEGDKDFYSINFDGTDLKRFKVNLPKRL
jgi:hypothetical protein